MSRWETHSVGIDVDQRAAVLLHGRPMRKNIHVPESDTFLLEVLHFLKCIQIVQEPTSSGRLQQRSLELVMAAYRSMETGMPVDIGYIAVRE